uniref:Potassium channel domain-containing protein n=1 Tax=Phlebotomus papatasi TaxID=29031 RepID=A0A1B0DCI0_PHLPP
MADGNRDVPCVVRRRRKINRQHHGQLAEGYRLGQRCSSDEDENVYGVAEDARGHREARGGVSAYRSKILGRRDRKVSNTRSQSTPRVDPTNSTTEVASLMRTARRSLSSPRHKDEALENCVKDTRDTKKIESPPAAMRLSASKVQENLKRFEEERKRLEIERRKFEQEKRDLDRLRVRKLEEFDRKRITEGYNQFKSQIPRMSARKGVEDKQTLIENFNRAQKMSNLTNQEQQVLPEETQPKLLVAEKRSQTPQRSSSMRETNRKVSLEPVDFESSTVSCSTTEEDVGDEAECDTNNKNTPTESSNDLRKLIDTNLPRSNGVHAQAPGISKSDRKTSSSVDKLGTMDTTKVKTKWELWQEFKAANSEEVEKICLLRNRCLSNLIILIIFCGIGGIIFRFVEGAFENFYKCGVKRVKRDFVDQLWISSHNLREEDWKAQARARLRKFEEELHTAHEAGMTSYSGQKAWSFLNGWAYCLTVVTTIGYGHISPATTTGRAITIVYAVIGIPIFLILLADFGKLFTRGIKFLWSYVRRLYYTGSCRKVRKQAQVQEDEEAKNSQEGNATGLHLSPSQQDLGTPQTPMPSEIEIDDEFNLPISLAFFILITYILIGASIYTTWEDWSFFESFYFVFISMSTIGFGDFVPNHPMYMMASIVYLMFGLSLTSMCINVVQVKLSDSFKHASAKIGATIGLKMAEEASLKNSQNGSPVDLASVHSVHSTSPKIELSTDTQSAAES